MLMIADNLIETIDDNNIDKTLICARTTKQIINLLTHSDFCSELYQRGYSWMTITSKTGAIIDGKKVDREEVLQHVEHLGQRSEKKFVVIHHSILSEGINVSVDLKLSSSCVTWITFHQSVYRSCDSFGWKMRRLSVLFVSLLMTTVGISTAKKVQAVVDVVFNQGQPAISEIRR